ncbi:MAG: DinB family protein, partial [Ignavibacteria bacterium]
LWKQNENKWCLLEIICHLYDEEREDFRTRFISVLKNPEHTFPSVDPPGWVKERKYLDQNFNSKLNDFIKERNKSIDWLKNLSTPDWGNTHQHPKIGPMSAKMIISNWLAHDYLHIRQIIRLKFDYLKYRTGERLQYASSW